MEYSGLALFERPKGWCSIAEHLRKVVIVKHYASVAEEIIEDLRR